MHAPIPSYLTREYEEYKFRTPYIGAPVALSPCRPYVSQATVGTTSLSPVYQEVLLWR